MDYLYLASRAQERTYRYGLPRLDGMTSSTPLGRESKTWDIARDSRGLIWMADEYPDIPLRCRNASGGTEASIGSDVISSAKGVTMDEEGRLWASNNDDGMIYCIALDQ